MKGKKALIFLLDMNLLTLLNGALKQIEICCGIFFIISNKLIPMLSYLSIFSFTKAAIIIHRYYFADVFKGAMKVHPFKIPVSLSFHNK